MGSKTYVAEVAGEAIIAFQADDDFHAYTLVREGDIGLALSPSSGLRRLNGGLLWDERTEIKVRPARETEHHKWCKISDEVLLPGDNPDEFEVFLTPVKSIFESMRG